MLERGEAGPLSLSTLLFALADDVLQCSPTFPIFQYAYDTLVILQADV
jgi:hypothetical protein